MPPNPYTLPPASSIPEVIQRLEDIQTYIGANGPGHPLDGIGCFSTLYTTITQRVLDGVNAQMFKDNAFMTTLDIAFANRYLDALRSSVIAPGSEPRPWSVLIDARADQNIAGLQFAAAGVNAHIDYDLSAALVTAWAETGGPADQNGPGSADQHLTYQQIDQIFAEEMDALRHEFETSGEAGLDQGFVARLLDLFGDWTVDLTRDVAWGQASRMWALRKFHLDGPYLDGLAVTAGLAGQVILVHL
jgi:hypothetical protein